MSWPVLETSQSLSERRELFILNKLLAAAHLRRVAFVAVHSACLKSLIVNCKSLGRVPMLPPLSALTYTKMDQTSNDGFQGGGMIMPYDNQHHADVYNDADEEEEEEDMYLMDRNTLAKGEAAHAMTLLPEDFVPSENDVICGRGRRIFMHPGNEKFRLMVSECLEEYSSTVTKLEKSLILCDIVAQVRANSPHGGFVKKDGKDGRWYEVGDFLAREKTSQAFRDALHDQYKSSNTAKKIRRQQAESSGNLIGARPAARRAYSASQLLDSKSLQEKKQRQGYTDPLLSKLRAHKSARSIFEFNVEQQGHQGAPEAAVFGGGVSLFSGKGAHAVAGTASAASHLLPANVARASCPNLSRSRASTGAILGRGGASRFAGLTSGGLGADQSGGRNFDWGVQLGIPSAKESSTANFERQAALESNTGQAPSGGLNFDWGSVSSSSKISSAAPSLARIGEGVVGVGATGSSGLDTKVKLFSRFTEGALGELTGQERRNSLDMTASGLFNRRGSIDSLDFVSTELSVDAVLADFDPTAILEDDEIGDTSSSRLMNSALLESPAGKVVAPTTTSHSFGAASLDIESKLRALRRSTFESSHMSALPEPEMMSSSTAMMLETHQEESASDTFERLVNLVGDVDSENPFEPDPLPGPLP
jgi:hypothetical protein